MRNFTKFLALVLAMLMVSACAVSVSAAFADQADVDASAHAKAIAVLNDLEVILGKDGNNFDPEGLLKRDEAAVIAAKLVAGNTGKKIEWDKSTTCSFADVQDAWSYGFINYVSQRGIMDGVGGGKFDPKATYSIAQALATAVKAAGLNGEVATLNETVKPSYWATNWIAIADKHGFSAGLDVINYDAPITRAEMAQVAYNLLTWNKTGTTEQPFAEKFGYTPTGKVEITNVTDKVVTAGKYQIGLAMFEEALKEAGYTQSAAELKNCFVSITYSATKDSILSIVLDTNVDTFVYNANPISYVKDSTTQLIIGEKTYNINYEDKDGVNASGVWGVAGTEYNNIVVTTYPWDGTTKLAWAQKNADNENEIITANAKIPTYYKAFAYDDDADGEYDRLGIYEYALATEISTAEKPVKVGSAEIQHDTIKLFNGTTWTNIVGDAGLAINYTGEEITSKVIPFLFNVVKNIDTSKYDVDVLEIAKVVPGQLTAKGKDYITLDSNKYTFVDDASFTDSDKWAMGQVVSIYTINNKYVSIINSASKNNLQIVVDKVVIENEKAVISGFNVTNKFAYETITIEGIVDNGKLYSKKATQNDNCLTGDNKKITTITVDKADNGKNWELEENDLIKILKTDSGAYIEEAPSAYTGFSASSKYTVKIDGNKVYHNGTPVFYTTDTVKIYEEVKTEAAKAADSYSLVSYNTLASFATRTGVTYKYVKDGDKIACVIINAGSESVSYDLAAGESIVYYPVANDVVVEENYVDGAYVNSYTNLINLLTGTKVNVTWSDEATAGNYYLVKDGKILGETDWISDKWVVEVDYPNVEGVLKEAGEIKAIPVVKVNDELKQDSAYSAKKTYGLNITIYDKGVTNDKGELLTKTVDETLKTDNVDFNINGVNAKFNADVFVVAGQMIIVLK